MKTRSALRAYLVLSGASTLFNAIMFTVQTVYYVTAVGMNPLQLVLAGTVMEIAVFLFEVPTGVVADTYSRRLSVIIGMFLTGAGFLFQGLIPSYWAILLGMIVWGIGATFLSGATEAWIVDELGEEQVGRVFLRASQIGQGAAFVGTFVSVGLASIDLSLPFVLGGGLTMALGLYLILVMPEHGFTPHPRSERRTWQALGATLRSGTAVMRQRPVLLMFLVAALFFGASSEGLDRLGEAHFLQNFQLPRLGELQPVVWFAIINAGAQVISFLATEIGIRRLDMSRPTAMARTLLLLTALRIGSLIVFGLAGSFAVAVGARWALAVLSAIYGPVYAAWLNQHITSKVRATVLSTLGQADALGQFVGGPAIGALGTFRSLRAAMVATGLVLSPALALYGYVLRRDQAAPAEAQAASEG